MKRNIVKKEKRCQERETLPRKRNVVRKEKHCQERETLSGKRNIVKKEKHCPERETLSGKRNVVRKEKHCQERETLSGKRNVVRKEKTLSMFCKAYMIRTYVVTQSSKENFQSKKAHEFIFLDLYTWCTPNLVLCLTMHLFQ